MTSKSFRDVLRTLQSQFSSAKLPLTLSSESRRALQNFVGDQEETISEEDSARANQELKNFWERYVGESPAKNGAFVGVLRELRPILRNQAGVLEWWQLVVKPVITSTGYRKAALDDAQDFLVGCMTYDNDDEDDTHVRAKTSGRLLSDLLGIYLARTRGLTEGDQFVASENAQVAQQVENILVAFGRKHPKDFFHGIDDLVTTAKTRLQALTLLSSFLRHQAPHLYLVVNTPLIEHLLKSLMNDTSTTVLSVALTSLIMLLPHIPGSLGPHLPRLFLVYSRLLCWEKFSQFSSEAQRELVTDDRVSTGPTVDHGDVGIDPSWEKARSKDSLAESTTPELTTYFTYLYGLYPLNFMSYIRKPRRYLKNLEFPGADDFDLDQAVIRSRTDQFRQAHLMHPNFYNMTVDEELIDPKWPRADPSDVVADCHALYVDPHAPAKSSLISPGPPPTGRLPEVPPMPMLSGNSLRAGQISPSNSHASFRSGYSWRDTQSTAVSAPTMDGDSPTLRPQQMVTSDDEAVTPAPRSRSKSSFARTSASIDDFPPPGNAPIARRKSNEKEEVPQTNIAYLQREVTLLRNDLNFERWHKAQYGQHIGQMMRKNVKDATAEAETFNLINSNRALKLQLEQVRNAREATIKDSALTRKQSNSLEANMAERFASMKKEQETWRADAEELRRLRAETKQYRELLVAAESRETNKSHQLEIIKRDLKQMQKLQAQLQETQQKLREYEYREFEFDHAKREQEILQSEKDTLQMKIHRHQQDQDRARRAYADKIAELEAQLATSEPIVRRGQNSGPPSPDTQLLIQQAVADSQARLAQLKKAHARLLEKHTDLELEYQSVKSQLEALQDGDGVHGQTFLRGTDHHSDNDDYAFGAQPTPTMNDNAYDTLTDYTLNDTTYQTSSSDPSSNRRFQPGYRGGGHHLPVSPPRSEVTLHSSAGLTFKPPPTQASMISRQDSLASRSSGIPSTFNQTVPLSADELARRDAAGSVGSGGSGGERKREKEREKIGPDSQVRVFGRGGAQNMKLKDKDKDKDGKDKAEKSGKAGGLRAFRGLV